MFEILAGAGILSVGVMVGWISCTVHNHTRSTYKCSCKHFLSSHDPKTGACHDKLHRGGTSSSLGAWEACPCRQYQGNQPPPELDEILRGVGQN